MSGRFVGDLMSTGTGIFPDKLSDSGVPQRCGGRFVCDLMNTGVLPFKLGTCSNTKQDSTHLNDI